MKKLFSLILFIFFSVGFAQFPIDEYKNEIFQLNSQEAINDYWHDLSDLDQNVLMSEKNLKKYDSISTSLMIRTALLFEAKGSDAINQSVFLPIINLSHNDIGKCGLVFWPIIEECLKVGGIIETFGGNFPAYELESVSLDFYNYSLFGQEKIYNDLRMKINSNTETYSVSEKLIAVFINHKESYKLTEKETIGKWYNQTLSKKLDDGYFKIMKMSDSNLYVNFFGRLQKLKLIQKKGDFKLLKIENEPFGWFYKLSKNGDLELLNEKQKVLIKYTSIK